MLNKRFTAKTFARRLMSMRVQVADWVAQYETAARETDNEWLSERLWERAEFLRVAQAHIFEAEVAMYQVPRLS